LGPVIGRGAFASVRLAQDPTDGRAFAVKLINYRNAKSQGIDAKKINNEVLLHKYCSETKHSNIIAFYGAGENHLWKWMAIEYAGGGDLFDKIQPDVGVDENISQLYFHQLVSAIGFLHTKGVAHRDVKPENIFLDANGNLKLGDFGLAYLFKYKDRTKKSKDPVGSPPYVAPEVIKGPYDPTRSDIWSCGIVLIVLLTGCTPWDEPVSKDPDFQRFLSFNGRPDGYNPWSRIPFEAFSLLYGLIKLNPSERLTIEEIFQHPWLRRPNSLLNPDGTCADPVQLAMKMVQGLSLDLNSEPTSNATNGFATSEFHSSQPVFAPEFEDEDLPNIQDPVLFLSQPETYNNSPANILPDDATDAEFLSSLPSNIQFTHTIPQTMSQAARTFQDICPSLTFTRFYTAAPMDQLVPRLRSILHRLNIVLPLDDGKRNFVCLKIRTTDRRRCGLAGDIRCTTIQNSNLTEVHFVKYKGDPVEWRAFFRTIVMSCKDLV
ncbi:hypothetical protein CANCADRAFT_15913, partial [Tortispora caseinolytica NRRL Y-17796]